MRPERDDRWRREPSAVEAAMFDGQDERFRRLTDAANAALRRREIEEASRLYDQAFAEAERLFEAALAGASPFVAPMAFVIACHNSAEAAAISGDRAKALALKRFAVERLASIAEQAGAPLGLRMNCVRHLRHALAFLAEEPSGGLRSSAEVAPLIARGRAVRDRFARLAAEMLSDRKASRDDRGPGGLASLH